MFSFFKRTPKGPTLPELEDLEGNALQAGDRVEALRYGLGESTLILKEDTYYYRSSATGEEVVWLRMIDAVTERQKVRKLLNGQAH